MRCAGAQKPEVTGNILVSNSVWGATGNSVAFNEEATGSITYCDAFSEPDHTDPAYHYYGSWTGGTGCRYVNPGFCDGSYLNRYWLTPGSPVRHIGLNPTGGNGVPDHDKDGRPRPGETQDPHTDMGAYEDNPNCQ